ncbi:MAG: ABC transporter ATP-binding protein [Candidatus Cloacimonadales bacterium]|jgi:putative ABC transport system ATP-binding protein|nr:ABC transporter ATP-binding protein [Candidatus Cloacimonadota bacterium]MDY0381929.1 ABC transporter ATP-binding protein [Candidatus Cloacimonadaceae bacterium]HCM16491.1 phosphonate ABC transporter ATP-binding protein [Candidatus Cloacimonas sp.]MCB5257206.1 ABC transporter ATP-binding protein [Candidatus Cloacimonadota bacterium]MCB5263888.1 ABC transporter ATP-binding protein [Candidatus Cloacimonadota bacterium]
MIELKALSKIYRTDTVETTALNELNLHIQKGNFVAIKGPSGCGKTTLLNIIGLMDKPSKGTLRIDDKNVEQLSERERNSLRRSTIGFLFQKFNLIESLSVFENVELPLLYKKVNRVTRREKVMSLLQQLGIEGRKDHFPHQLSGGQQQRVSLARSVINDPQLILADEPTGNLDSANGREVMRLLSDLHKEGRTILMVTHDDHYAEYAGQIILLNDGMIV